MGRGGGSFDAGGVSRLMSRLQLEREMQRQDMYCRERVPIVCDAVSTSITLGRPDDVGCTVDGVESTWWRAQVGCTY